MRVRLLGPIDVMVDGASRPVRGLRRRAVLAVLALHHGEIVSTGRLIDVVWSDSAPTTAVNTVQCHVSQLRHVLGHKASILARPPGYVLDLGSESTDVEVAERLIEKGRQSADAGQSVSALRAALALWRGRPLVDVAGLVWLDEQAERLDRLRLQAKQALIEARLALGEHALLVPDLEQLTLDHPFDEHIHGLLMVALYRAGRQADALAAYRRLRHALGANLGIDPSQELRDLETAILRQDPALDPFPPAITPPPAVPEQHRTRGGQPLPLAPAARTQDQRRVVRGARADVLEGLSRVAVVATPVDDTEALLAGGARALVADGDLVASREWFERAYRVAERAGDARAMAVAVLGLAGLWVHEDRTASGSASLLVRLRHALSRIDPLSSLALRLRVRLAGETDYRTGEHAGILAVLDEARHAADAVAQVEALSLAHHCLLGPDHGVLRRALAVELIGESVATARRSDLLMGLLWHTVDLFLDADPHAQRRLAELRELLAQDDHLAVGFVVAAIEVMRTIRAGRFDEAEALAQACAQRGTTAGDIDAAGWHGAQLIAIRWYQGRLPELLPMLTELVHSPTLSAVDNSYFAALAVAAAMADDRRTAAGALATLCGRDLAALPRSSTWLVTMNGIVQAAHLLDDTDTSTRAYKLLSPFAQLPMVASLGVVCFGSVHHALGIASLTTGDVDTAVEHLRAAVHANLALAHWPAVMTSRVRYAQALAHRARPQDTAAAQRELATATEEATALSIPVLGRR